MRKSDFFLACVGAQLLLMFLMFVHAAHTRGAAEPLLLEKAAMVREMELTDLCLFTDSRYTRHPSMADMHSAFQDLPMSFEHFPSGSLMAPPPHLGKHETN
jgi:hypothetical protein